jgi:alkanesulfonate monooxygenase SsuD/methylene tetrahydromethanopterin reductase-like flavin-dependent oxidoreductase (luciferase family)
MGTLAEDPGTVKFIYWDNLTYPPSSPLEPERWDARAAMDLYDSYLAHAVEAERLGFAGVSMPEHFVPSSPCPSPNLMMAALAARTSTIRIISGANVPLHHVPMELAAEFAMLDVLSHGRIEAGLGRHGDLAAHARAIDIMAGLLYNPEYTLDLPDVARPVGANPIFTAIPGDRGDSITVTLCPRPLQRRLPFWLAASSEDSLTAAAERGHGLLTGLDPRGSGAAATVGELVQRMRRYVETGQRSGHDLSFATIAINCHLVIADTDAEAVAIHRNGLRHHFGGAVGMFERIVGGFEPGQSPLDNPFIKASLTKPDEDYLTNPFMFVGTAATVRAKLDALLEAGFSRFITVAGGVGVQHDIGWASARALATDVAPDLFGAAAAAQASAAAGASV